MKTIDNKIYSSEQLIIGNIKRKYIDIEWMSKITTKEFLEWKQSIIDILILNGDNQDIIHDVIETEISDKEKRYQLLKERGKIMKKTELLIVKERDEIMKKSRQFTYNTLTTCENQDYDVMTASTENYNGRIYPKNYITRKGVVKSVII